jgi:hypothetical protein
MSGMKQNLILKKILLVIHLLWHLRELNHSRMLHSKNWETEIVNYIKAYKIENQL